MGSICFNLLSYRYLPYLTLCWSRGCVLTQMQEARHFHFRLQLPKLHNSELVTCIHQFGLNKSSPFVYLYKNEWIASQFSLSMNREKVILKGYLMSQSFTHSLTADPFPAPVFNAVMRTNLTASAPLSFSLLSQPISLSFYVYSSLLPGWLLFLNFRSVVPGSYLPYFRDSRALNLTRSIARLLCG